MQLGAVAAFGPDQHVVDDVPARAVTGPDRGIGSWPAILVFDVMPWPWLLYSPAGWKTPFALSSSGRSPLPPRFLSRPRRRFEFSVVICATNFWPLSHFFPLPLVSNRTGAAGALYSRVSGRARGLSNAVSLAGSNRSVAGKGGVMSDALPTALQLGASPRRPAIVCRWRLAAAAAPMNLAPAWQTIAVTVTELSRKCRPKLRLPMTFVSCRWKWIDAVNILDRIAARPNKVRPQ